MMTLRTQLTESMALILCTAVFAGPGLRARARAPAVRMMAGEEVDIFSAQRVESVKAAVVGALSGGLACAPVALVTTGFNVAQWEFEVDTLAAASALFAITYRYTVRQDLSPMLRQGAVGAFALSRASAGVRVSDTCVPVPLRCGPAGLYLDLAMVSQGASAAVVGTCAFGAAAAAIDYCLDRGWISKSS